MKPWPVIMYNDVHPTHNGIVVGYVKSGTDKRSGRVRHVASNEHGVRIGTFDTFREAQAEVRAHYLARHSLPLRNM